jgi:tetratricopeptide (TPR) repeat protein
MTPLIRILCTIAIAASLPRAAIADDEIAKPTVAEAKEHLAKGTKLYRLREFDKAIEEYKAGALVEDAPVFHYNLGQCYRQLGRPEDAIWHYQRFLDRANPLPPKYKQAAEDFIRDMKAEIERRLNAKPNEPAPIDKAPDPKLPVPPRTIIDRADPWYTDGFGWGLTGTGALASGVSIWLLVDARDLEDQANMTASQQTQDALRSRASQRRLAGEIVGAAGGVALVVGIVKLAIAPKSTTRVVGASFDLMPTSNGLAITGRF